jgi:hypothetical protein
MGEGQFAIQGGCQILVGQRYPCPPTLLRGPLAHSIYAMLAENEPSFSDINERNWARVTRYAELSFHQSLQAFSLQRENLVNVLNAIPFESWERSAIIFERRHTVFTQTRRMAKHEAEHLEQIDAVLRGNRK